MPKQFYGEKSKANANMPKDVKMKDYPKAGKPLPYNVKDDMEGLDQMAEKAFKKGASQMYNQGR